MSRRLIGDDLADAVHLERSKFWKNAIRSSTLLTRANARLAPRVDPAAVWFDEQLTERILALGLPDGTRFDN